MKKRDERRIKDSCWNRAHEGELVFVLLGRDVAAPAAIRAWAAARVRHGKNFAIDPQITEALDVARLMENAPKDASLEDQLAAAERLCQIYFKIAVEARGEDQVRALRDAAISVAE